MRAKFIRISLLIFSAIVLLIAIREWHAAGGPGQPIGNIGVTLPTQSKPEASNAVSEASINSAPTVSAQEYAERVRALSRSGFRDEFANLVKERLAYGDFGFDAPYSMKVRAGSGFGDPYIKSLLFTWGEQNPNEALAVLSRFSDKSSNVANRYIDIVLAGWATVDAVAAWDWALDSARGNGRQVGSFGAGFAGSRMAAVADQLVKSNDFQHAAALASRDDEYSGIVSGVVAGAWAKRDIMEVATWIATLPTNRIPSDEHPILPDTRGNAVEALTQMVGSDDPNGVRGLITIEPDPVAKNSMATGFLRSQLAQSPAEALKWLVVISNDNPGVLFSGAARAYIAYRGRADSNERALISQISDPKVRSDIDRILFPAN